MNEQIIKILFVEDDEVDQLAFKREVSRQKLNYDYQFAFSAEEAKGLLESEIYDIVITDYNLGDGTALDVLESVKDIPLIVTTGAGDEQIAINTMKAGAYDYIVKDQARKYLKHLPSTINIALKQKQEAKQFEMLSTVLMNINDMVNITDMDNRLVFVNDAFVNNFGYTRSELIGEKINKIRAQNLHPRLESTIQKKTLEGGWKGEIVNRRKDGSEFPVFLSTSLIYGPDGKPTHLFGVSSDITESKKAKEALASEKERLSVTLHNIGAGVITTDEEGVINSMNKAAEEITRRNQQNAVGQKISDLLDKGYKDNPSNILLEQVLSTGKSCRSQNAREIKFGRKIKRMIQENAAPIKDHENNIKGVVYAIEDVTDKLQLEDELRRSHKLESLGVLAGGIAHDFNNILTTIIGNISLAMMKLDESDKIYPNLSGALKACERSRDLTQQLLTFAKGGAPIKENASIVDIVKDTAEFTTRGSGIKCEFNVNEEIWNADVDVGQISQVINNLVINATHAMVDGGTLHIDIVNLNDSSEISRIGFLQKNWHYVKINIRDEGIGIPEKIIHQIFDPYFSTKKKGSGLGLASSYSIIKQHDGYIQVESEENIGTTFTIYLPANITKNVKKEKAKVEIFQGNAKILVMDDDESIQKIIGEMLKTLGYEVKFTTDGDETIKVYSESMNSDSPFDVLILDLTIPGGKGGKETIEEIIKMDPEAKALVASGYADNTVMSDYKEYGFSGRLLKPFGLKTLSIELKNIVDKN